MSGMGKPTSGDQSAWYYRSGTDTWQGETLAPTSGTFANRPAAGNPGRLYFATDTPGVASIDTGQAWNPLGIVWTLNKAPTSASWSNLNQGPATTFVQQGDTLAISGSNRTLSGTDIQGFYVSGSASTPYTVTALFCLQTDYASKANSFSAGLFVASSGNSRLTVLGGNFSNSALGYFINEYNSPTSFNANSVSVTSVFAVGGFFWFRVKDNGIQRAWYTSTDGTNFVPLFTESSTNWIGSQPDQVGIFYEPRGNNGIVSLLSYSRTSP